VICSPKCLEDAFSESTPCIALVLTGQDRPARPPQLEGMDALLALIDGRDHPLARAARESPNPRWANSFYSAFPIDGDVEDLSEGPPAPETSPGVCE
jgi:hypothetical protein